MDDKDDGREFLLSMRGVRSLAGSRSSSITVGAVAVVTIVGSAFGTSKGERGGVSAGSAIRRDTEYSARCVYEV